MTISKHALLPIIKEIRKEVSPAEYSWLDHIAESLSLSLFIIGACDVIKSAVLYRWYLFKHVSFHLDLELYPEGIGLNLRNETPIRGQVSQVSALLELSPFLRRH